MHRALHLIAAGIVAGAALSSVAGAAPEATTTNPPVGRVARDLAKQGASIIVSVSVEGRQYAATAGKPRRKASHRFRIGSVTKTFTAAIVLQLVDEGKLRLADRLEAHLPGVVPRGADISIRQLLQHRSGLANYTDFRPWLAEADRSATLQPIDVLRFAAAQRLVFDPGTEWRYSNTNYVALGLIVEKITGRTFAQELRARIIDPLGLDRTQLPVTPTLPDLGPGSVNPVLPWAAGAIVSNTRDVARFYSALLSGRP
jgi:D-alanyl-D-alanine carboxypeptidase